MPGASIHTPHVDYGIDEAEKIALVLGSLSIRPPAVPCDVEGAAGPDSTDVSPDAMILGFG